MRIGIDVTNFYSGLTNGTPVLLYNLIRALSAADQDIELRLLYAHRSVPRAERVLDELRGPGVEVVRSSLVRHGFPPGGWWYPFHPDVETLVGRVDVFHAGDFVWPGPGPSAIVASVLDLTTRLLPETHPWANRWRDGRKLRWAARVPDRIFTISEATARDVHRMLGIPAERVDVVPLARGTAAFPESGNHTPPDSAAMRYGLGGSNFILAVGTLEPRKNLRRLVEAFDQLPPGLDDVLLVLAGGPGWRAGELRAALRGARKADRIRVLGFLPAEDLHSLYAGAQVFAYPSLYEGFGLPVLEAMSFGVPVLTSNVSSLPEVAGEAAVLVDPRSVEQIRDGLARLLTDPALRQRCAARGRAREQEFTWRKTADKALSCYRTAAARHGVRE